MTDTKTNIKNGTKSKVYNLRSAMLEFQKLAITAKKDGKNPHFRSNYSTLESVITAVNQGNQFGLFFTQEIDYVYVSHMETKSEVVVVTTVRHVNDESTYVSKLPIMSKANYETHRRLALLLHMQSDIHCSQYMVCHQKMMMVMKQVSLQSKSANQR